MDDQNNVTLRVIEQGSVRVNVAHVHRKAPGIVCIYVDMHSKRVETPMTGGGDNESPTLCFTAGEDTLHLDESKPRDSMTIVEFSEYVGWHVFACSGPSRYTLCVVLVAPEASAVASGEATAEHKTISVRRFRDPSGAPTCCADHSAGETCRFLGVRNFGIVDVCMLGVQRDLDPRTTGFQRPDTRCEVWTTSNADDKT